MVTINVAYTPAINPAGATPVTTRAQLWLVEIYELTGTVMTNMVSDNSNITDEELQMTYFFEWLHPDVEGGSDKEKELTKQHKMRGKMSVSKSIESMRKMVMAGNL